MDNFPIQMALFGLADMLIEPFCYGCAAFVVTYRFSRTIPAKILVIAVASLFFLWMDDIWPAIGNRSARIGWAAGNQELAELFQGSRRLGEAEYSTGESSGLWDIFDMDLWDVGSAIVFVGLGFQVGLLLARRRWDELASEFAAPIPPRLNRNLPPPPPRSANT